METAAFEVRAAVLENRLVAEDCFLLAFDAPAIARAARPGQFVQVDCGTRRVVHHACDTPEALETFRRDLAGGGRPFLRRPFSIYRPDGDRVEIIYRVIGAGTEAMSRLETGESVRLLGPLGNTFPFPAATNRAVLVAGGIGLPPLLFLAQALAEAGVVATLLYGVRTKDQVIQSAVEAFEPLCESVEIAVEEAGQGYVTDLLGETLRSGDVVYAVGPKAMLQAVSSRAAEGGNDCHLLMEEQMACGIGVCLSCMQQTISGYRRVCAEGPVFDSREVVWE